MDPITEDMPREEHGTTNNWESIASKTDDTEAKKKENWIGPRSLVIVRDLITIGIATDHQIRITRGLTFKGVEEMICQIG